MGDLYTVLESYKEVKLIKNSMVRERYNEYNYIGTFKVFSHAKNLAMQLMQTKVTASKAEYEGLRANMIKLGHILKSNIKE